MDSRPTPVEHLSDRKAEEWLTYTQTAERLGISAEAVRQIAIRRRWPRRKPNDTPNGQVQVLVPNDVETRPRTGVGHPHKRPADTRSQTSDEHPSDARSPDAVNALREAVAGPRDQLERTEARAEAERARTDVMRGRAGRPGRKQKARPRRCGWRISSDGRSA